jgi:hypothetical protein
MSTVARHRAAAALLAALLLAPGAAHANDRDLRATTIPASACIELDNQNASRSFLQNEGYYRLEPGNGVFRVLHLRCPLPLNNIDLGGATDDNDISKLRVLYRDPDGGFGASRIRITLKRVGHSPGNTDIATLDVCTWISDLGGLPPSSAGRSTQPCPHDLPFGAFYTFIVEMVNFESSTGRLEFAGIDFPS